MLNSVISSHHGETNMTGVFKKIGLGIAASVCLGAIAACQPATDTTESSDAPQESVTDQSPDAAEQPLAQSQTTDPNDTSSAPEDSTAPANVPDSAGVPEAKPVPPLPAECTNPQTQLAMNTCAKAEYDQADVKLNNAYQSVKAAVGAQQEDQLVAAEQAWITFRDEYCDFVQAQYAGGSIQPTVYYGCLTQLTSDRTTELQQAKGASMSYEAADQELNNVYQALQDYLSPAEQEQLTDAQLAWIDYRDAHCAFEGGDTNACLAQVTETRVQHLRQELDTRSL
jgi:uncharacterized protein YecT (DUF1311 family)